MDRKPLSYASPTTPFGDRRRWSRLAWGAFASGLILPLVQGIIGYWASRQVSPRSFLSSSKPELAILVFLVLPVCGATLGLHALERLVECRPRLRGWASALAALALHTIWSLAGVVVMMWAFVPRY